MTTAPELRQTSDQTLDSSADEPNLPEVSGTTFPLLTTVLAGFAVTIAVQLIIRPESEETLPARLVVAIVVFLASTLLFISSIVFAVNAQGHNYLPFIELSTDGQRLLGVRDHVTWLNWLRRGWDSFHVAALVTFYAGIFLLLAGVNVIVWEFVGPGVAAAVLVLIIANIALTVLVGLSVQSRKRRTHPDLVSGQRVTINSQQGNERPRRRVSAQE